MDNIIDYNILAGYDSYEYLAEAVQQAIKDGFQPHGSVIHYTDSFGQQIFCQPIVKYRGVYNVQS